MTAPEAHAREVLLQALPAPATEPFEDWGAILSRAGVARRRALRPLVLALALLALVLLAAPAVGIGSRLAELFWEKGEPVDTATLGELDRWLLEDQLGEGATVQRIASDGSLAYYVMRNDKGESCLASGRVGDRVRFGNSACGAGDVRTRLPSAEDPIYTEVAGVLSPGAFELIAVVGLAATGVAEVALVGTGDDVVDSAPVTGNVFQLRPSPSVPMGSIDAVVAYDEDRNEVYREPLRGR